MKRWMVILLVVIGICQSCDTVSGPDCFKKQGEIVVEELSLEFFDAISIASGIELHIRQSDSVSVRLEAGKNFIGSVKTQIDEGMLKVTNESKCQLLRNYHPAKLFISVPNLTHIHSTSQYNIYSDGVLKFPQLWIESGITEESASGIIELELDSEEIEINDNVSAVYRLKGKTDKLKVGFWGQSPRLEGEQLKAKEVFIYHRSSNDMILFPIEKLEGSIRSTGNVILKNVPPIIEVETLFSGHLIYP